MYSISNEKKTKGKLNDILLTDTFPMGSSKKVFIINGCKIKAIKVSGVKLATPIVTDMVYKKFKKLLERLADLLVDDDDSGESYREALNEIERFHLIIKNKYRAFLMRKDLELMSKKLVLLQKEAESRLLETRNSYYDFYSGKRSR